VSFVRWCGVTKCGRSRGRVCSGVGEVSSMLNFEFERMNINYGKKKKNKEKEMGWKGK
jgi:hypothetical protein